MKTQECVECSPGLNGYQSKPECLACGGTGLVAIDEDGDMIAHADLTAEQRVEKGEVR